MTDKRERSNALHKSLSVLDLILGDMRLLFEFQNASAPRTRTSSDNTYEANKCRLEFDLNHTHESTNIDTSNIPPILRH